MNIMKSALSKSEVRDCLKNNEPTFPPGSFIGEYDFSSTDLSFSSFDRCVLQDCSFRGCNLKGVSFQGSNLSFCNFNDTDMREVDMNRATVDFCLIGDSILQFACLENSLFFQTSLVGSDLTYSELSGAKFIGCQMSSKEQISMFDFSSGRNILFRMCELLGTSFDDSVLAQVEMNMCSLSETQFVNAVMTGAEFRLCDLKETNFTGARIVASRFVGDLRRSCFQGAALKGVEFNRCRLANSNRDFELNEDVEFIDCGDLEGEIYVRG